MIHLILFLATVTAIPLAANMVPVCAEGCTITASSGANVVYQYGAGTKWCQTLTSPKLPMFVSNGVACPYDPDPNVVKAIAAQQQTAAYTVSYSVGGVAQPPKTIPALTPPPVTPTGSTNYNCTLTMTTAGAVTGTCTAIAAASVAK